MPTPAFTHLAPRAPADVADTRWDVVIVGAGPAGAIMGLRLARRGRRVLLVDRRRFPRDKACGDGLIPDSLAVFARHGLLERVQTHAGCWTTATVYGPYRASVEIEAEMLTLRREVLDALLVDAAVEAGAVLAHGLVVAVDDGAEGATVRLASGDALVGRLVVIATGANVALLERCGLLERAAPSAVAIRTYVRSAHGIDQPVVSFDRHILPGYGWIFPMGDGTYNVGCGVVASPAGEASVELRAMLATFLTAFPLGRALAAGETAREAVRGAMIRYGLSGARPYAGGHVVAIGEAIGTTYPFTGEGIGKAMETAELASDLVMESLDAGSVAPLAQYATRLQDTLRPRYRAYEAAQKWIAVPGVADLLFYRARRRPRLRNALSGILRETVDPSRVISGRGLVRALLA